MHRLIREPISASNSDAHHTITQPEDVADLVATMIALPNTASVSELLISCRMETWA